MATKNGKLARGVSIIGVGCTPFGSVIKRPELLGLTENELFAWACLEAMKDAGIEGKDIDALFVSQLGNDQNGNVLCPNVYYQDWVGMHGKPSYHHEEACGSPYLGVDLAVMAVASGKYDIVLTAGIEIESSFIRDTPSHIRTEKSKDPRSEGLGGRTVDMAYTRWEGASTAAMADDAAATYVRNYGLTSEQMDDALNHLAISNRRNAARISRAFFQKEHKDIAIEKGMKDAMEYLRSDLNPKLTEYLRLNSMCAITDGAAAMIVCPTEMAKSFLQQPIEILGTGVSSMDLRHPHNLKLIAESAINQVYEGTGIKPEEIDLFMTQDLFLSEQLETAELAGYIPQGEMWRYAIDGRTAFDGDKPINVNGGRTSFGHAYGTSGLADFAEAVWQMRGKCGERQVKKLPEVSMIRGMGGAQHGIATIIRTQQ